MSDRQLRRFSNRMSMSRWMPS